MSRNGRIRVALIANPSDLGGITAFWGAPRRYARFLGLELGYYYKNSLLVVMPAGIGYSRSRISRTMSVDDIPAGIASPRRRDTGSAKPVVSGR